MQRFLYSPLFLIVSHQKRADRIVNLQKSHCGIGTKSCRKINWITLKLIFCLYASFIISDNSSINAPAPIIHYDINMVQIGSVTFVPSSNTLVNGNYEASTTVTLKKMNQYGISNYEAHFGWRGVNIIIMTQSQGFGLYGAGINAKTATSITIVCHITQMKFVFLTGNYILIHPDIVAEGIIFGADFHSTTPCVGQDPIPLPNFSSCIYPYSHPMATGGTKRIISIRHLVVHRDDLMTQVFYIDIAVRPTNGGTSMNIEIQFGKGGSINEFYIGVVVISNKFSDLTVKKNLQFQIFQTIDAFQNPVPLVTRVHPLLNKGFDNNFFVGIKIISTADPSSVLHYNVIADSDNNIVSSFYLIATWVFFRACVYFGYKCPSTAFYFDQVLQQCQVCQDNCVSCYPNIYNIIECLQCATNFILSSDKLSCVCEMTQIATVCDNFFALGLNHCTNAVRNGNNVQCNFCTVNNFQQVQSNQCQCKVGYNDLNGDGICKEICGDGIFFDHQCDDRNTKSNDGCSSNCLLEPGFTCDTNQPTFCHSLMPLKYKIGFVERITGQNKGRIKLNLMNSLTSLPYDLIIDQFMPSMTHVRLFLITSQSPNQEIQIEDTKLLESTSSKEMFLEFSYPLTVETLSAKITIDYGKTRYAKNVQELKWNIKGINNPLIYSDKLATYGAISIFLFVGTIFGMIGLFIGVMSPKYIGLESLITLQLIFYSQTLISDPQRFPIGFMYLKYLKFSSGYNQIFKLSEYIPFTINANKLNHLGMHKTIIENFNINFAIMMVSILVFLVIFTLKHIKESQMVRLEENRKQFSSLEKNDIMIQFDATESIQIIKSIASLKSISERVFWIVNHFCVWMFLPIMASIAAQILIGNEIVEILNSSTFLSQIQSFGPLIAFSTVSFITVICMNNFKNIFLSSETMKKTLYKPEELIYKRILLIYLLLIGSLVFFCNNVSIFEIPLSVIVILLQIIYIIVLIIIHPYKQSLRIHTITLLINQVIYLVFLFFINLINFVKEMDETLIMMLGYFITGCCGFLMILTGVRLYYELRYGEQLEIQIQKERAREEELQKQQQEERLERKKKQLQSQAKNKQSQKQIERERNPYLLQNQIKQDKALDVIAWLQKCNWQAEEKERFFFSKFSQKPMEWLKNNKISEYQRLMEITRQQSQNCRYKQMKRKTDEDYQNLTRKMKNEGLKNIEILHKKLQNHEKRIKSDMNYSMKIMKNQGDKFVSKDYTLVD